MKGDKIEEANEEKDWRVGRSVNETRKTVCDSSKIRQLCAQPNTKSLSLQEKGLPGAAVQDLRPTKTRICIIGMESVVGTG